jgi:hypothetical protein
MDETANLMEAQMFNEINGSKLSAKKIRLSNAEASFQQHGLPPGVNLAPRGELYPLGGMLTP